MNRVTSRIAGSATSVISASMLTTLLALIDNVNSLSVISTTCDTARKFTAPPTQPPVYTPATLGPISPRSSTKKPTTAPMTVAALAIANVMMTLPLSRKILRMSALNSSNGIASDTIYAPTKS